MGYMSQLIPCLRERIFPPEDAFWGTQYGCDADTGNAGTAATQAAQDPTRLRRLLSPFGTRKLRRCRMRPRFRALTHGEATEVRDLELHALRARVQVRDLEANRNDRRSRSGSLTARPVPLEATRLWPEEFLRRTRSGTPRVLDQTHQRRVSAVAGAPDRDPRRVGIALRDGP